MSMIEIVIPKRQWPGDLLNVNSLRGQTRFLARRTAPWRELGALLGVKYRGALPDAPVRVFAEFRFPTRHRRDTPNLYPTAKALIDGIVDAGVLSDDCDGVIEGPWLKRVYPNGPEQITLVLVPIPTEELGQPERSKQ